MSVSSTEGVASSGLLAMANASSTAPGSATADQDTFLQLLVAQLKYQDPMNPTDSSAFMAQNAQFQALSAMQDVSNGVQQMLTLQMSFGSAAMIGRQVSWTDASGATKSGVATGVNYSATGPVLTVGDTDVPIASVTAVTSPSTSASA